MSFFDKSPRSASVRTIEDLSILVFPFSKLSSAPKEEICYIEFVQNISKELSQRIRNIDEVAITSLQAELESVKTRFELSHFLFMMFVLLSTWTFSLVFLKELYRS